MTLKLLALTTLALGLSSGAAFADRGHGGDHRGRYEHRGDHRGGRDHRGGQVVIRDHGRDHRRGNTVVVRDHDRGHRGTVVIRDRDRGYRGGGRVIVRGDSRYRDHGYRRPIYVSRPVIRHRYYNYYSRPSLIVENYNPIAGYYWVRGSWSWNGFEWIWTPGHYEPDPSYYGYYDNY
jgi:hypothetical protein